MLYRLFAVSVTLFWIAMNALLWRTEFKGAGGSGASVPVATIWQKILTAPDDSSLGIFHRDRRIGFCRWSPNVGQEEAAGKVGSEDTGPEGQIKRLSGFSLDLEGNAALEEAAARLRFTLHAEFKTNRAWRSFSARVTVRPTIWELRADADRQEFTFKMDENGPLFERTYKFSDLRNPQILLRDFGVSGWMGMIGGPGLMAPALAAGQNLKLGVVWQAQNGSLKIGQSPIRVYRLETKFLDRYRMVIFISRVGEILRVELPEGIVLTNDGLNF